MPNSIDVTNVESIDREIGSTIRKLSWLQLRRDELTGATHRGPRGPKGPTPQGDEIRLRPRTLSPTETAVVEALKTYPDDPWTADEIHEVANVNRTTMVCAFTKLVRDGYVRRVGINQYKINPKAG